MKTKYLTYIVLAGVAFWIYNEYQSRSKEPKPKLKN